MRRVTVAIVMVLFNVISTYAGRTVHDFVVFHYTTENGLPQNSVKAIAADTFGFYWLATEGGLVRFDGRNFKLFDKANTGIGSNRFVDIMKDHRTGILLAIADRGSILSAEKGCASLRAKGKQGHATPGSYVHQTWKFGQEQDYDFKRDTTLLPVSQDKALLLTRGKIFWFLSGKKIAERPAPEGMAPGSTFNIGEDLYWLSSAGRHFEVQRITPKGTATLELTGDIRAQKAAAKPVLCVNNATGQTFLSYGDGLYLVERDAAGKLNTTLLLSGFDLSRKDIAAASYHKEQDMLLLGSKIDGLYVFKKKYFQTKIVNDVASPYNVIQDQVAYDDSSILTDKGIVFSTGAQKPYFLPEARTMMRYSASRIMRTSEAIWIVSGNTLYRYAPDFNTLVQKWVLDFQVSELAEVPGGLWLGTPQGRIFSIGYRSADSSPRLVCTVGAHIQTIKAYEGKAWIGTSAGLYCYDLNDHKMTAPGILRGKTVRALHQLGEHELWIGTYDAGFYCDKNGTIKQFPADRNNYLNAAHCILEDNKGYLWITTNNGIFQILKKDLLSYDEKAGSRPYYQHYNKEEGFISNEFNGGNDRTSLKLPNGSFCFSSMKGWVFFNPDSIKGMIPDKEMIIDKIEAGNNEIPSTDSLVLQHAFDPVTITVATAYFGNPDNLQYEYRFDNGKWLSMKSNQVAFNALSSGNHILAIRKRAGFGNRYSERRININVVPAWWETRIFKAAVALIAVILLWLSFRLRFYLLKKRNKHLEAAIETQTQKLQEHIKALKQSEEQLTKENKFQQRLTNHIAHDIRTPLKYLTFSSKHLYDSIRREKSTKENDALEIYKATEQLFHFTGRLISYLNLWTVTNQPKENVAIAPLIEQKFTIFALAAKERNIKLMNRVPAGQVIFGHDILIDILLHNLIDNGIKHTREGTVTVDFETLSHDWVIFISDTGNGMREEEIKAYNEYLNDEQKHENKTYTGLGFSIIKNILPLIGASLILSPNQPRGIVVRLVLPSTLK
ncbi:ligand-binding sensor domain-containing protein [Taibaiella koreensis]|uniref:ligand-binding sensor domain-containing protein n=1 Tax=Taibaiella koreensis TaxID=1268548 RepID=UPI0013C2A551|nr:HAMP domain-containing sensor histidine kinase [Taibaiella koreensis]